MYWQGGYEVEELATLVKKEVVRTGIWVLAATGVAVGIALLWK